jgi:PAS domain S-box-containing protein
MTDLLDTLLLARPDTDEAVVAHLLAEGDCPARLTAVRTREELRAALQSPRDLLLGDPGLDDLDPVELAALLAAAPGHPPFVAFAPGLSGPRAMLAVRLGAFDAFDQAELDRLPLAAWRARREGTARREGALALAMQSGLVHNSPVAIAVLDSRRLVTRVNPAFEALFGYTQAEAWGRDLADLIVPEAELAEFRAVTERLRQGHVTQLKSTRRRKDGSLVHISAVGIPVALPEGNVGVYAVYNDLTPRMRALEALRRAESNYRDFFMNAVEGMYVSTPLGRFVLANPALARLLGYASPAEVTDSVRSIRREIYSEPGHRERFLEAMRASDVVRGFPARVRRKDGSELDVVENVRAIRDDDGDLLFYQGTMIEA